VPCHSAAMSTVPWAVVDLEAEELAPGLGSVPPLLEVDLQAEAELPTVPVGQNAVPVQEHPHLWHAQHCQSQRLPPLEIDSDSEAEGDSQQAVAQTNMPAICDECGELVSSADGPAHIRAHRRRRSEAAGSSSSSTQRRLCTIPCEECGQGVAFEDFEAHVQSCLARRGLKRARSADVKCPECGLELLAEELEDHTRAHRLERRLQERSSRAADQDLGDGTPETLAFQVVKLLRERGCGLPGNRPSSTLKPGMQVHVLWNGDMRWYRAVISADNSDGTYAVSWAPPYQLWPAESRQRSEGIAALEGAETREIVNFDVCVSFVKRMMALAQDKRDGVIIQPEIVFHWTPAQNHTPIIENSLLVPGEQTASGTTVSVVNGEALGKGIYTSTDPNFGASYGGGARGAFMCLGLPGLPYDMQSRGHGWHGRKGKHGQSEFDSRRNATVRVYTNSDLLLPCFITEVTAVPRLTGFLQEVAALLLSKIHVAEKVPEAVPEVGDFRRGQKVEAVWSAETGGDGSWWEAEIRKKHRDGTYQICWSPPYHLWKHPHRLTSQELRASSSHASQSSHGGG